MFLSLLTMIQENNKQKRAEEGRSQLVGPPIPFAAGATGTGTGTGTGIFSG